MEHLKIECGHISLVTGTAAEQYAERYKANSQVVTLVLEDQLPAYTPATARTAVNMLANIARNLNVAVVLVHPYPANSIPQKLKAELDKQTIDELNIESNEE
jgi:hypothetical protein